MFNKIICQSEKLLLLQLQQQLLLLLQQLTIIIIKIRVIIIPIIIIIIRRRKIIKIIMNKKKLYAWSHRVDYCFGTPAAIFTIIGKKIFSCPVIVLIIVLLAV